MEPDLGTGAKGHPLFLLPWPPQLPREEGALCLKRKVNEVGFILGKCLSAPGLRA